VNGIPLVFIELKASHKRLEDAYKDNLRDYRSTIPQLFWFNAFIVLSNGGQARIGSATATWEHFVAWKKINDEGEEGVISLETLFRGTCEPARMLDIVENFTVFEEATGGLVKKIGMTHQVLGVNRAIASLGQARANAGRLGVFWHTQGSGKSLSMIFFAQKILRKLPGNWTFVVVTDRDELDEQIFKQFVACGAVRGKEVHAQDGNHLQTLLSADHRYVFTLIQKFRPDRGATYPALSTRSDIIVITDEAPNTLEGTSVWKTVNERLSREYGVFRLGEMHEEDFVQCQKFLLTASTERALDIIEMTARLIDTYFRKLEFSERAASRISQDADDALEELNARFREHSIGFQYEHGQLIRVDSQYVHAEVVKPALVLLAQAGFKGAEQEFHSAHKHYREKKFKEAAVDALKALESTMKIICDKKNWTYPLTAQAKDLTGC
jgi:hypothetical protein